MPPAATSPKLSVIMPVYNEAGTFSKVMELVVAKQIPGVTIEVIVVESGSTDGSREEARRWADHPRVRLVLEDRPGGKGRAVRRGLDVATGDFVLIQDADLEYDVDDYDRLVAPLLEGRAAFVLGRRVSRGGRWRMREPGPGFRVGHLLDVAHFFFLALFNVVYGQRLHDPFTMYKVFRLDCLDGVALECDRFDFDWELVAKLIRSGHPPLEVPVSYRARSFSAGKKVRLLRDPLTWVRACFKYRFAPLGPRPQGGR